MDKRYIFILIIFIICSINLYTIAINSDVVGSANVECGKYTCSIPNGFSLYDSGKNDIYCGNGNGMYIFIYTELGRNSNYANKLVEIENSSEYHLLSNGTIDNNGIRIDSIFYYQDDGVNRSTFYFTKDNHSFRILITGFDYDTQRDEVMGMVVDIVDSMKLNYKKG